MKVGDYVRTKYGNIGRVTSLNKQFSQVEYQDNQTRCDTKENNILKSSPNIIDLIEEDDFIDGMRVSEIKSNKNGILKCMVDSDYEFITTIKNNDIESVVTKEQFSQMEYRIGE